MFGRYENVKKVLFPVLVAAGLMESPAVWSHQLSGPIMGYVADSMTSTLRVMNGIPGASTIGNPVSPDLKVRNALLSIKDDYALAVKDDSGELVLITNLSGATSVSTISGVYTGGDLLALSPDGSSAAVYSVGNSRIQIIDGLPSAPIVRFEVDTVPMGPSLNAMAINPNEEVLAAFSNGEAGTLYSLAADGAVRFIATVGNVSGITFSSGDRAVIADRGWNQITLFQDLSTTATPIPLANSVDGISDPLGVLLSHDEATAYVANAGSGSVTVINLTGGTPRDFSCNCRPTAMQPLQRDSVFALSKRTDEPIVLFDGRSADTPFLVVPPEVPTQ